MQIHNPFVQLNGCTIINNEAQEYQNQLPQARYPVQQVQRKEEVVVTPSLFWTGSCMLAIALAALVATFQPNILVVNNQAPPTTINNNFSR
jgi:hypothetical protein